MIQREAALSAVINGVISLGFFLMMFGASRPVPLAALASDGLPQTFMVTLMGSIIPGLIIGSRLGRARLPIVLRAFALAFAALVLLGGAGWLIFHGQTGTAASWPVLSLKTLYGAVLGALVTALTIHLVFNQGQAQ